jgi:energy-coupling factor transporter ATP-binding protein EcfA2
MSRWNISNIFFIGEGGRVRILDLRLGEVNIFTGASGTGKSTLIKALDYCLGSSKCELAAHVKRHSVAVGVKWVLDDAQMITARLVPPVGQGTSTKMFVSNGRNLPIPNTIEQLQGATTVDAGKAFIERAFGIACVPEASVDKTARKWRPTVRHATAYMFVPKDVIYNETALLHGLDQADEAPAIIETMPYFLRVVNEDSVLQERRLRDLRKQLEREERQQRTRQAAGSDYKKHAIRLLLDASRSGLCDLPSDDASEKELEAALLRVKRMNANNVTNPNESELGNLYDNRRRLLSDIEKARRQSRATRSALQDMVGFQGVVRRQYEKLKIAEHLQPATDTCPLCDTPTERGIAISEAIRHSMNIVRSESVAVENVRPRLIEHEDSLQIEIARLNLKLRETDERIKTWVRQSDEAKQMDSLARYHSHLLGKVSQFLEMNPATPLPGADLNVLREQIQSLEALIDGAAKQVLLSRAERKVSQYLSEAFSQLPTVAPCIGADLEFSTKPPDVAIIEQGSAAVLRLHDAGSAIHIALSFALQKYLGEVNAPVPAFLAFDQISRPYYPQRGEDESTIGENEEVSAMRRHIDFLFKETAAQKGLQVLLIEHAFFGDDPRYVAATRKRWNKLSEDALIPRDWPKRPDTQ